MRKLFPLIVFAIVAFASCTSSEEEVTTENDALLKSYTITRDSQGKYSINYELKENTDVNLVKNIETNTNEIYLFSGKVAVEKSQSKELVLENDQLKVGFYEGVEEYKGMSVQDEEIILAKGIDSGDFLEGYSITDLGNNTFQVDFKVKEGIMVWYEFNEEKDTYEVHLKEGASKGLEYSKTYIKTSEVLKIDFVNYFTNSAKGVEAKVFTKNKPKLATT